MFIHFFTLVKNDETYPTRPITLVVPYAGGGCIQLLARTFAEQIEVLLEKAVRIQNAGVTCTAWFESLRAASDDGHTLLWHSDEVAQAAEENYIGRFNVVDDVVQFCYVLAVGPRSKATEISELSALFHGDARKCRVAIAVAVAKERILPLLRMLQEAADGELLLLNAANDEDCSTLVAEGTADVQIAVLTMESLKHLHARGLRALAITGVTRLPELPLVPTMIELGHMDIPIYETYSVLAPEGTHSHIIGRLAAAITTLKRSEDYCEQFGPMALIPAQRSLVVSSIGAIVET